MGALEDVYDDLDTDVPLSEFRAAVEAKVEQMGGLADEETAAMLIAHELSDDEVSGIADIEPGMEEVKFLAKVRSVGELRTFEREGEDDPGRVVNVEAADETGVVRLAFWDEQAVAVDEDGFEEGTVLRVKGRPKEGLNGIEVSVYEAQVDEDAEIEVALTDEVRIEDLALGQSDVNVEGRVLDVGTVRTFDRDDGSQGRVANLTIGDETGRVRVTLWDERTEDTEELSVGESVEVVDGYVRERDGSLELHVGNRGAVETTDAEIEYVPQTTPIDDLELEQVVDIGGVIRSADPVRTFDRDDGSEGQVRNVRVQDETGDIRVALWGEKADVDLGPGDTAYFTDVEIRDGWQEDLEASAGWRSTVTVTDASAPSLASSDGSASLSSFGEGGTGSGNTGGSGNATGAENVGGDGTSTEGGDAAGAEGAVPDDADGTEGGREEGAAVEFTGVVVQPGDPTILDDGEETMRVVTDADLSLGEEVTARGTMREGRLDAEEVF
ncbi:single-stranded DNA binding protein [Natronorarus salvus]|uniref:single-stranded DNA binding protein n=1 Tax=Natronorarus salvus TaxID=3117733 RepID=UPI002F262CDF